MALGEHTRPMDLGMASHDGETRYFSAAGGTGFDAQVAFTMGGKRARWQRGRAGYFLSTLNELRRYTNRALSLRLTTDAGDRHVEGKFLFVAFANGPFYGGGMRICPDASISDGLLDLCLAGDIGRLGALRELPGIYRGAHVNHPLVEMTKVRELRIEGEHGDRASIWTASRSACCRSTSACGRRRSQWRRQSASVGEPMSETAPPPTPRRGQKLLATDGRRIGTVDAVFADYLLVRTSGLLPVDLYVPRNEVELPIPRAGCMVGKSSHDAYRRLAPAAEASAP